MPRDAAAAAALYQAAAASGDPHAHLSIGYLAETGDGVPQDYVAARAHYQAAVDAGLAEARLRLAICYLEGWGGPVDRPAFVREVRAAAEANVVSAQNFLSTMHFFGFAVAANQPEAVKWLERAAKQDDAAAQHDLGTTVENARSPALAANLKLARTWYQLSAEQEYLVSMRAMARTFLAGAPGDRNWAAGQRWLLLATENGDAEAPYILAYYELLSTVATEHDPEKARTWLKLAAERANSSAREVLQLAESGLPLDSAMKRILTVQIEDRYVAQQATRNDNDKPTRPAVLYRAVKPNFRSLCA